MQHTIGSYNMSFASDLGVAMGSEKHFIVNGWGQVVPPTDPRMLWKNAAIFVKSFWDEVPTASAMGMQEMNTRDKVSKPEKLFLGGAESVKELLADKDNLAFCQDSVLGNFNTFPTLLTVWDKVKLGDYKSHKIYDIGIESPYSTNTIHKGRPFMVVITEGGYVLVNLHSPNDAKDSWEGNTNLRPVLNSLFTKALNDLQIDANDINSSKVFIMGDFNDPHMGIKLSNPLELGGRTYNWGLDENKVLSCCYNFNSSCGSDNYDTTDRKNTHSNKGVKNARGMGKQKLSGECEIDVSEDKVVNMRVGPTSNPRSLGDRGKLVNYKFTGDYVLGKNVVAGLSIYRPVLRDVSLESDHEMVIATFAEEDYNPSIVAGGKRSKGRRSTRKAKAKKSKQAKKSKASRKH